MINASQVSQSHQTANVSALEENTSTATSNVSHVSTTVPFVQVKQIVLFVTQDISYKIQNVLQDVMSDITFQELFVKNVKMVAHIVKELVLVLSVKLEDMHTMDYVMSTVQLDLLPKLPT